VILVLVIFAVLAWYVQPALNFFNAWRGANAERVQLHQLSEEHTQLVKRAASLKNPATAAEQARRLGMIVSGERSYVVKGLGR
jgi:cell division protein FtsB